MQSLNQGK